MGAASLRPLRDSLQRVAVQVGDSPDIEKPLPCLGPWDESLI